MIAAVLGAIGVWGTSRAWPPPDLQMRDVQDVQPLVGPTMAYTSNRSFSVQRRTASKFTASTYALDAGFQSLRKV